MTLILFSVQMWEIKQGCKIEDWNELALCSLIKQALLGWWMVLKTGYCTDSSIVSIVKNLIK